MLCFVLLLGGYELQVRMVMNTSHDKPYVIKENDLQLLGGRRTKVFALDSVTMGKLCQQSKLDTLQNLM